ncbi:MAG: LamG-like jellyroll fold domain-containing protein [Marinoscillum sp.]
MKSNHSLETRLAKMYETYNWPLLLLIILLSPLWSLAQPPVASGDCSRSLLEFDGANDEVSVSIPDFSYESGTIEAWVRKDNWQDAVDDALFSNGISHTSSNSFYLSFHNVVGLHFRYGGGSDGGATAAYLDASGTSTNSLAANSWHHVAATWDNDGSNTHLSIYLDGALVTQTMTSANLVLTGPTTFGISKTVSGSHYVLQGGSIGDVRVWDVTRTSTEISDNKDVYLTGTESGLIGYWPLDDGSGSSATNLVSEGNAGTLTNMDPSTDWVDFSLMEIKVDDVQLTSGGIYNFGVTLLNESSGDRTFTITNGGSESLELDGSPVAVLSGANADQFTLDLTGTSSTILAGESTQFTISFDPENLGESVSSISLSAAGCDDPFVINLRGVSSNMEPPIADGNCGRNVLEFDGVNDYVAVSIPDFSTTSGTIEGWVRKDNWQDAVDDAFFSNGIGNSSQNSFYISFHPAVGLHFRYGGSEEGNVAAYDDLSSTSELAPGSWHHVAATWNNDGSQTNLTTYLDGVQVATASTTSNLIINAGTSFGISKGASGSHYPLLGGAISEVRVWDFARSQSQIVADFSEFLDGNESGLIAYWPLDELSGTASATNLVEGGEDGVLQNMNPDEDWVNHPIQIMVNNDLILSEVDFDFGHIAFGESSEDTTFTITNLGPRPLNLEGSPIIELSGDHSDQFSLDISTTATTLESGASTTFTVGFNPTSTGRKNALFSIVNESGCPNPYTINLTGTTAKLSYDGAFTESATNDGSVTGSMTIELIGDTFQDTDADDQLDIDIEVMVSNIPSGLTPLITLTSSTTAELTLSGNAFVHQSLDGINSIDFEFDDSAFSTLSASEIDSATGPVMTGIGITFTVNPVNISYEGADFEESATNNGSLDGKLNIILNGDTFNETDGALIADTDFTLSGIPNGLTAGLTVEHNTVAGQEWSEMEIKEYFNGVGIAYGNGVLVALSNSGPNNVMVSSDGTTWTHVAAPSASWRDITFGNGVFMAVGDSYVMTSTDGLDWTVQTLSTNGLYSVNYCNGLFVIGCVWSSASAILTSPDGITWTSVPRVTTQNWEAAAYGEGVYVAVGSSVATNNVLTSTDGVNWSIITTPSGFWYSVTYAHGVFVAVGRSLNGAGNIMTSSDGVYWQLRAHGSQNLILNDVTYGNGQFVAVANSSSSGTVVTSTDAINWVTHSITSTYSSDWRSVAYGNGLFVALQYGYKVVRVSGSRASLSFTGQASNHQDSDNLSDLQIDFSSSAFATSDVSDVLHASSASTGAGIIFNDNDGTITFGGSGFVETVANEGAVDGSISITLTGDTFQDVDADNLLDVGTEVFLPSLPEGFTPIITLNSSTEAVLTLSGNAKSHQDDDDIDDFNIVFDNSAFTSSQASAIANATGPAQSGYGIDFSDNTSSVSYFGTGFSESPLNDGSVSGSITIALTGDTFEDPNANNQLEPGSEIVISGLPDGLTPLITLLSTDTAIVTLIGNALSHSFSDAVEAISVTFLDAAFTSNTAAAVANATGPYVPAGFRVDFEDNATLSYSGSGFVESEDNDGSLVGSIVMNLSNASFQDDDLDSLLDVGSEVLINSVPGGMDPVLKIDSNAVTGAYWEESSVEALGWQAITYGKGVFVAVATYTNKVMTSTDGINWTLRPTILNASDWYDVTYGNGLFVAVGGGNVYQVMTSPDGINWTARTVAETNYWNSVTYGNGLFVAISGSGTQRVMTSTDGIDWTLQDVDNIGSSSGTAIAYGNGLFVATWYTFSGGIATSPDGISWTLRDSGGARLIRDVAFGNGLFVAVTSFTPASGQTADRVLTSSDGINWTVGSATEANAWRAVTYGGGQFVAISSSGTNRVMTSPDGENWTVASATEDNTWLGLAYGNGKLVAVSSNGTNRVMTSSRSAKATLTFSGKAIHHQSSHNLADITFDFDNSAFPLVDAATIPNATGPASSGFGISFDDNTEHIWIGGASGIETDWNTAANWSLASVPDTESSVIIPPSTNQPVIESDIEIATLEVQGSALLTVNSNSLSVNGSLMNNGSLIVTSGASLITLGSVSGADYQIERITTFNKSTGRYSVVGAPVASAPFDVLGTRAIIYGYDESVAYELGVSDGVNRFKKPNQLGQSVLQVGQGYFSARTGDENGKVIFMGTPNHGTIEVDLSFTDQESVEEEDFEGFNLVANPYPAAISFTAFVDGNTAVDVDESIYIWDDYGSDNARGTNADYLIVNTLGNTDSRAETDRGEGSEKWDGYIRSGQGFFVKANSASTLQFTDAMKVVDHNDDDGFFRKAPVKRFKLAISDTVSRKATIVGYVADATLGKDKAYDAMTFGGSGLQLYSLQVEGNKTLGIQGLPTDYRGEVRLGFSTQTNAMHTIELMNIEEVSEPVWLLDQFTGATIDLSRESYTFTTAIGEYQDRFRLKPAAVLGTQQKQTLVYAYEKTLHIKMASPQPKEYRLYNLSGQQQATLLVNGSVSIDLNHLSSGVYLITDGIESKKIILK